MGLLVGDMRERLNADAELVSRWRAAHREAVSQELTAGSFTDWVDDQLTQAAVGWLLTSVFVRFCEDNLLLGESGVWITHVDVRLRQRALDAENAFYQADPDRSYREWLEVAFAALRTNRATAPLVDEHAAIGIISPSSDAVHQLLSFWRRTDDDGNLLWRFDDDELSTRFLGDLYQDLSEYAKKKYALLQTPVFVEEFILEQTLIPALAERPLEGFKVIDPTCGSGHFLLGAFEILVDRWHREAPGMEARARVNKALESVYGVDVNPFATAIAMFRLIVAALKQTGDRSLVNAPAFTLNLASGDSLLHGPDALGRTGFDYGDESFDKDAAVSRFSYRTEDVPKLRRILAAGQYDVVVGNPPYITVKDKALNARYREIYHCCKGKYALTVPFMERFFQLAKPGEQAGWVGQITSNSFMKREFGAPLIEDFLPKLDLRLVADTSGAYIPGHSTPTVIIIGRARPIVSASVRAILSIQGEPGAPEEPAKGDVWVAVVEHVDQPGYQDQWISVVDLPRDNLSRHPWSLTGGSAVETLAKIEQSRVHRLSDFTKDIGMTYLTGEDDAYLIPPLSPLGSATKANSAPAVVGDNVRDYSITPLYQGLMTQSWSGDPEEIPRALQTHFWRYRSVLSHRLYFGQTPEQRGLRWYDPAMFFARRHSSNLSLVFPFVATHNHFVLDRGGRLFNRTAPIIKLPVEAHVDDYLELLGVLNSSSACFWLKQNCFNKGNATAASGMADQPWSWNWEFTGTTLQDLPLPQSALSPRAHRIDMLASELAGGEPSCVVQSVAMNQMSVEQAMRVHAESRASMASEQEELDWEVYYNYGL
ncbi:BREX-2 system adenine-specific DNA-methyltransferase PglX, partial [Mycobacterium sp. 29Ha]|uniref:BREX-2 system adenine-specific DNA-methyltransferase PglX n=1 Tax=Mycobacterium sp. 29Ha TaxID=2939268 RepID=UPI0029392145